jgi:hypothetical protein
MRKHRRKVASENLAKGSIGKGFAFGDTISEEDVELVLQVIRVERLVDCRVPQEANFDEAALSLGRGQAMCRVQIRLPVYQLADFVEDAKSNVQVMKCFKDCELFGVLVFNFRKPL